MGKIVNKKSEWKPVNLGVGDFEGLIGIEEMEDYDVDKSVNFNVSTKKTKMKKTKKKKKKKKEAKQKFVVEELVDCDQEDLLPWTNICVPDTLSRPLVEKGFKEPREIQRLCIPAALKGRRDILGAAETGSGKTLAFGIPMLYGIMKIKENEENSPQSASEEEDEEEENENCVRVERLGSEKRTRNKLLGLVITPTRELAIQVKDHLVTAAKYTGIKIAVIVGGLSMEKQTRILNQEPEIVVGTPGRLWELINGGHPHMSDPSSIRFLAIDETDRMVERDHYPELRSLLECINAEKESANKRQNFVFSATLTLVHDAPKYIKQKKRKKAKGLTQEQKLKNLIELIGMSNYKIVDITKAKGTAEKLRETKISCTFDEKDYYLYYFLTTYPGRTLIFCNSISSVRRLASLLNHLGHPPLPLHANMQQRQRLKNLDKFKERENSVLLATDVAARGLDIPCVKHVIHYQVPRTSEGYIHRSGRTARGDNDGLTVLLVEPSEVNLYAKLCTTLNRENDLEEFPIDMDGVLRAKEIVRAAREIDAVSLKMKRTKEKVGWLEKAAEEMDIVVDDDKLFIDDEETAEAKRFLVKKRRELEALIKKKKLKQESKPLKKKKLKLYKNK